MSWVLLSNDDGVDSPALLPFATALEQALGLPVAVAVPAGERSWSGKAVTRFGTVRSEEVVRGDRRIAAVHGTPADAVQLGLHGLFAETFGGAPPQVVVTGVNLGFNSGAAFLASSGTVWAAAEAAYAGLPAVAVSTGALDDHHGWNAIASHADAARDWDRVAEHAAELVRTVGASALLDHADLVSVNLPWAIDESTRRRVTSLAPLAYGALFESSGPDQWQFARELVVALGDHDDRADVAALRAGAVSITPVLLPHGADVPDDVRTSLER